MFKNCLFNSKPHADYDLSQKEFTFIWVANTLKVGPDEMPIIHTGDEVLWAGILGDGILLQIVDGPHAGKYVGACSLDDLTPCSYDWEVVLEMLWKMSNGEDPTING